MPSSLLLSSVHSLRSAALRIPRATVPHDRKTMEATGGQPHLPHLVRGQMPLAWNGSGSYRGTSVVSKGRKSTADSLLRLIKQLITHIKGH